MEPADAALPREPLVLVVADTAVERVALTAGIPATTPILLASDLSEARKVLAQLPGAAGRRPRSLRPAAPPPDSDDAPVQASSGSDVQGPRPRSDAPLRLREDRLSLTMGEREAQLTALEFTLLRFLLPRLGEVATFEQLSQVGWRTAYLGSGAHMHAAIGRLRSKIAELGAPLQLEAVRGLGFRLIQHPSPGGDREAISS